MKHRLEINPINLTKYLYQFPAEDMTFMKKALTSSLHVFALTERSPNSGADVRANLEPDSEIFCLRISPRVNTTWNLMHGTKHVNVNAMKW